MDHIRNDYRRADSHIAVDEREYTQYARARCADVGSL